MKKTIPLACLLIAFCTLQVACKSDEQPVPTISPSDSTSAGFPKVDCSSLSAETFFEEGPDESMEIKRGEKPNLLTGLFTTKHIQVVDVFEDKLSGFAGRNFEVPESHSDIEIRVATVYDLEIKSNTYQAILNCRDIKTFDKDKKLISLSPALQQEVDKLISRYDDIMTDKNQEEIKFMEGDNFVAQAYYSRETMKVGGAFKSPTLLSYQDGSAYLLGHIRRDIYRTEDPKLLNFFSADQRGESGFWSHKVTLSYLENQTPINPETLGSIENTFAQYGTQEQSFVMTESFDLYYNTTLPQEEATTDFSARRKQRCDNILYRNGYYGDSYTGPARPKPGQIGTFTIECSNRPID